MTNEEISAWIDKHAGIRQRMNEVYTRLGYLESKVDRLQAVSSERLANVRRCDKIFFKIARKCMEIKDPEKTLQAIYEITMNAHRELANV